jgi:hypothetical protein
LSVIGKGRHHPIQIKLSAIPKFVIIGEVEEIVESGQAEEVTLGHDKDVADKGTFPSLPLFASIIVVDDDDDEEEGRLDGACSE